MPDDTLTATLEEIQGRYDEAAEGLSAEARKYLDCADIPRLLDALRAVLELAGNARCVDDVYNMESDAFDPVAWNLDPAKVREAVSRALGAGEHPQEEAGDG